MTKTWDDTGVAAEVCPVCRGLDVRVREHGWFMVEFERGDDVRAQSSREPGIEFACIECGSTWD